MVGEALPLPPGRSVGKAIERAAKGTYRVYGKEGEGRFSFTHYGEFAGNKVVPARLAWMAGLEWLDRFFRPQGPTPLGHAPEPEPTLAPADPAILNLTEAGIAGWASEMSARDSTWTWQDGVIKCQPKEHEYGWLRCPVAVDDFILTVEWQVPARGNAGIFLRARPVDWFLPADRGEQAPRKHPRPDLAVADRAGVPDAGRPRPGKPLQHRLDVPATPPRPAIPRIPPTGGTARPSAPAGHGSRSGTTVFKSSTPT